MLPPVPYFSLLYILAHDPDSSIREAAVDSILTASADSLLEAVSSMELCSGVLDALARLHFSNGILAELIVCNPEISSDTLQFLAEKGLSGATNRLANPEEGQVFAEEDTDTPVDEESDEFLSKYQMAQQMGIAEKIKTALTGDKEWRNLLIKDANKLVSGSVIKNPRITEAEVLTICKGTVQNDEIIRVVCGNKEWVKNYQIRKSLVENHKTPLPNALRYLNTLTEKDIAAIAKSKNVNSVISNQARRIMTQKLNKR